MAASWLLQAIYTSLLSSAGDLVGNTGDTSPGSSITPGHQRNTVLANTAFGTIRGRVDNSAQPTIFRYLGVPYAKPPVGELRFQAPVTPDTWPGVRDALTESAQCWQPLVTHLPNSEDCLYLNIYAPVWGSKAGRLPVMVFIHGGSYYIGAGSKYNGTKLARKGDVLVVTINYRLDVFGFLSTEDSVLPGNYGLLDQIQALKWIQQNIHQFGGDPNSVTIFGESSGSTSVSILVLSPLAKALNAFVLLNVPYKTRYIVNGCLMLIGLFGVAYAMNFGFAIACIAIVGSSAAFGENVTLGYLSWFPSALINAWSSGTGMAGVLGSSIYIIFGCAVGHGDGKTKELHNLTKTAFLLTTPVVLIYWLSFFVVVKRPVQEDDKREGTRSNPEGSHQGKVPTESGLMEDEDGLYAINISDDTAPLVDRPDPKQQEPLGKRILRCLRLVLWLGINLCLVYIFEYVSRGCAAKVRPSSEYNVGCPELYAALQLCYQLFTFCCPLASKDLDFGLFVTGRGICVPIQCAVVQNPQSRDIDSSPTDQHDSLDSGRACKVNDNVHSRIGL
ncbi:carboxylic ester hydrolase [Plakobranchus ocellatus]|uniref:Carboxylic ester hydrolase n=1 Tax=Plakobranchus ocellatus TaxID=259542 RepID=A0AAV4B492_9GAST|nr:carboxylic ester hydrolase [Plakobranchus ocellatus]